MMHKYSENRIVMAGTTCAGKTTFAKEYSKKFGVELFDFDANWPYSAGVDETHKSFISRLPKKFITDGVPYATDNCEFIPHVCLLELPFSMMKGRPKFLDYCNEVKNDIKIVFIACTDKNELVRRHSLKPYCINNSVNFMRMYSEFHNFYFGFVSRFDNTISMDYFDSYTNEFVSKEEFYNRLRWIDEHNIRTLLRDNFKAYFSNIIIGDEAVHYDEYYQDIECINLIGYSQSFRTWGNIKNLINWQGKKVADVGCAHCYFSFKAAAEGAVVTGFDHNDFILIVSNYLNQIAGNPICIKKWVGGEEISADYDVALCLNVIHHFTDVKESLRNIKSNVAIFETNTNLIDVIASEFNIIKKVKSHRKDFHGNDRIILLCERRS